jgi:hypothetical protein
MRTDTLERANRDFVRARLRAHFRRLGMRLAAWARGCCAEATAERATIGLAACFSEELEALELRVDGDEGRRVRLGLREVKLSKIVGSVGRCRDFDEDFRPLKAHLEYRWKRVYEALLRGEVLPAVRLLKVSGRYFVEDGNHRVSAARYRDAHAIDADVTEILPNDTSLITEDTPQEFGERGTTIHKGRGR